MLSSHECIADIDSLVFTLAEVHPDIYSRVGISDFMNFVDDAKVGFSDSISVSEFYERIAPLVAMVGDSHTVMLPPGEDILEGSPMMLPFVVQVNQADSTVSVINSESIPSGSKLISINGERVPQMVGWMLNYISGEQMFYRFTRINEYFPWLFQLRYGADEYVVEYQGTDSDDLFTITVAGIDFDDFSAMTTANGYTDESAPYEYSIPEGADYAILNFTRCSGEDNIAAFADSMVADLHQRGISKLIIDIRENSGGNSAVGDTLLRRLSKVPFIQYEEVYCRVNPVVERLLGESVGNNVYYYKVSESDYEKPLPPERRFNGECVLLTSHKTFSSASSFARAFKHFGVGKVVGEETGGLDIHFGDIVAYTLPNSELTTLISIKRFRLPGADENSPSGTLPDLAVPAAEALNAAIGMLESSR